ncbi:MAG TPA: glycerophosphodiester phosphodiesterase [Acidimicrobiales bacterium]|nr:glycerophosphodiester phosphodiesterase [Acidimicrobiales bacterium]
MTKPFLDHRSPIPFAHRGGASAAPENTLAAFQYAVDEGYTYVETDVHATADGVLIAFHDDRLDRVTDRTGLIAELSWREVREARVDGSEPIPLFEELLTTWPDLRVNVDPKADRSVEPLIEVIGRTGALDRVCVGAFSDRRIDRIRDALGGDLCTGMGPRQVAKLAAAATGVPFLGRFRSDCAQVPVKQGPLPLVTRRFIETAHDHGVAVHVWTIDDAPEMERLLDLGVDGIMTDRPSVLREVLVARGQWDST